MPMVFLFVFKQKTAYEMRISDWSSDVCSSDLPAVEYPPASSVGLFVNQDIAKASNRDDFETSAVAASGWTRVSQGTSSQWNIVADNDDLGSGHFWYAPDPASTANIYLITPPFSVPVDGSLSMRFDHHYDFESLLPQTGRAHV